MQYGNTVSRFSHIASCLPGLPVLQPAPTSFLFRVEYYSVCVYHWLFIHLSVDGRLGCFSLWAILKSVAVDGRLQIFVWVPVSNSWRIIPRSGIAGSDCNLMLNFLRNCRPVSTRINHFTFPPAPDRGSYFSASSPILIFCFAFFYHYYSSHPSMEWVMGGILWFDLHLPPDSGHGAAFCVHIGHLYIFLYALCPFLNWVVFFVVEL